MKYDITHITRYTYEAPVASADLMLRLTPVARTGQTVEATRIVTSPSAFERNERHDFFGNATTLLRIAEPHSALEIKTETRVIVVRPSPPAAGLTRRWNDLALEGLAGRTIGGQSPVHFIYASPLVPLFEPAAEYARLSFPEGCPVLEGGIDLMRRIRREFRYDPGATDLATPLAQAFKQRGGVCQDFAHIMISGLRGLGLPAAYISGYIRTIPPPGKPRLQGADASHAWVALWCGAEFGWIGLDPTNALLVGDDHIEVAMGRDYADVSPVRGVFVGSGRDKLTVSVDVAPVIA